jgi:hypothetical protein
MQRTLTIQLALAFDIVVLPRDRCSARVDDEAGIAAAISATVLRHF